ncbi:hypothetical protein [Sphaerospermopsis sp. FACHB-1194]|nr:hypothetical protein [Sphaerospermopsis sp. FACHB-1194]
MIIYPPNASPLQEIKESGVRESGDQGVRRSRSRRGEAFGK